MVEEVQHERLEVPGYALLGPGVVGRDLLVSWWEIWPAAWQVCGISCEVFKGLKTVVKLSFN